ncbi:transglycosylase domain-containing protein [Solitalea sp. MAHUQ-68]|uniref:Transglycosylase domain-containing protein n=1 Tax=Solitalea agri TaxID=2953739 RepID=A0A9X2F3E0_9SPHI|nr:transglycosylase domain-containing protein [Solitalea agri]MCO4293505.1 transglycosylase domain-containing protein [Solitalea agri]
MTKSQLSKEDLRRYIKNFWLLILGGIGVFTLFILSIALGLFGKMPSFRDLENPKSNIASELISGDGKTIGTYYLENRSFVKYSELSPNIVNALIATEDSRFYDHSGIDFSRTFTIVFYNLIGKRQGASTITQQLAKKLFGRQKTNIYVTKIKEWVTAVKLERNYTKQEILAMYLNTVDFGSNAYGIKTAARTFFNTTPDQLSVEQAALLIGILKGPSYYSPIRYPERALSRRNTVLDQMVKNDVLTSENASLAKTREIKLDYNPESHNEGLAAYFREHLRLEISKMLDDGTIKAKPDGSSYDLYRDGLKIYTTIDSRMQQYAEEAEAEHLKDLQQQFIKHWKNMGKDPISDLSPGALEQAMRRTDRYRELKELGKSDSEILADFKTPVKMTVFSWKGEIDTTLSPIDSIKYYKRFLRSAMMSMDPQTGYVKAWVGGDNFKFFKYDQVATGARQVGSTFKPFVYTAAIDNGFSPCMKVPNEPVVFEDFDNYSPKNADGKTGGMYTLREGLAQSKNLITMFLMKQLGPKIVSKYAHDMGITAEIPPYPSIGLGVADITLYDMVGAYSTFANKGIWTKPIYLLRIEDKNGNIIYENKPEIKQAISAQTAYVMCFMLKGTTTLPGGTGLRLRGKYKMDMPIGAKTGTTQNQSDGWFMGVTPSLVTGVWTGCEDRSMRFHSLNLGEGANTALPAWALYMKKVYADPTLKISKGDFARPDTIAIELDCTKYATEAPPAEEGEEDKDRLGF